MVIINFNRSVKKSCSTKKELEKNHAKSDQKYLTLKEELAKAIAEKKPLEDVLYFSKWGTSKPLLLKASSKSKFLELLRIMLDAGASPNFHGEFEIIEL